MGASEETDQIFDKFAAGGGGLGDKVSECHEGGERPTQACEIDAGEGQGGTDLSGKAM